MADTETERKKTKPGVRTSLNSGENKVKINLKDNNVNSSPTPVNPTAEAVAKTLPTMRLSTETNWASETSSSVLNAVTPVSSERSLGDNKVVPIKNSEPIVPVVSEEPVQEPKQKAKPKKKPKVKEPKVVKEPKNKYKEKVQKEKNNNSLLADLKSTIAQGIDSIKVDYDQLAQIQAELHTSAGDIKSSLGDRINRIKDYTNAAVANTANTVKNIEMPKFKKNEGDPNYDIPKEEKPKPKPQPKPKEEKPKVQEQKPQPAPSQQPKINETTVTTEEMKAAAAAAEASAAKQQVDKDIAQKLNQAMQRLDGAKNALNALNSQLQYTPKDQQKALKERIKQKEAQLAEAEKIVADLQSKM